MCARWVENPYYQYLCGEEFFRHALPLDRSSITRWRDRMGEERLEALLQESLAVATRTGAMKPNDLSRVIVDTTVQPKNITFPTDAKLLHAAINGIVRLAKKHRVQLRQSYLRIAKRAAMMAGRYAHAKQFKRHHRQLRLLRTRLGRIIRDVRRKIAGRPEIEAALEWPRARASQIHSQQQRQRAERNRDAGSDRQHRLVLSCEVERDPDADFAKDFFHESAWRLDLLKNSHFTIHVEVAHLAMPVRGLRPQVLPDEQRRNRVGGPIDLVRKRQRISEDAKVVISHSHRDHSQGRAGGSPEPKNWVPAFAGTNGDSALNLLQPPGLRKASVLGARDTVACRTRIAIQRRHHG